MQINEQLVYVDGTIIVVTYTQLDLHKVLMIFIALTSDYTVLYVYGKTLSHSHQSYSLVLVWKYNSSANQSHKSTVCGS